MLVAGPQQPQVDGQRETFAWPLGRPNDGLKDRIMPDLRYPIGPFEAGPLPDCGKRNRVNANAAEQPRASEGHSAYQTLFNAFHPIFTTTATSNPE